MTEPRDDQLAFERFVRQGDAELDTQLDALGQESPGAELDAAILKAATEAVKSKPRPRSPFGPQWGWAIAATVVLTVGVVTLIPQQTQMPGPALKSPLTTREQRAPVDTKPQAADADAEVTPPPLKRPTEPSQQGAPSEATQSSAPTAAAHPKAPAPSKEAIAPEPLAEPPATPAASPPAPQQKALKKERARTQTFHRQLREDSAARQAPPRLQKAQELEAPEPRRLLDQIQRLIAQEEWEQARALLARFQARYPEQEVPETIVRALKRSATNAPASASPTPDD